MEDTQIIIYQASDGASIEVKLKGESVWLNQYQLADLFGVDRTSIAKHIRNVYKSKELNEAATCAKIAQVQQEGERTITRKVTQYNLNLMISVGYRVNSMWFMEKNGLLYRRDGSKRIADLL